MEPGLARAITGELRATVRAAGTRRALATTVHVGHPDAEQVLLPCPDLLDQGLRADLVERALDSLSVLAGACAWLSRRGELRADR